MCDLRCADFKNVKMLWKLFFLFFFLNSGILPSMFTFYEIIGFFPCSLGQMGSLLFPRPPPVHFTWWAVLPSRFSLLIIKEEFAVWALPAQLAEQTEPPLGSDCVILGSRLLSLSQLVWFGRKDELTRPGNMAVTGCTKCIKYMLFFFNFIFWVSRPYFLFSQVSSGIIWVT